MFRKVGINGIAFAYNQALAIAIQFLLVPIFLRYWGAAQYGEWIVLSGITTMLTILNFGLTHASSTRATILASRNDWDGAKKAHQTAMFATLCILLVFLPVAYLASNRLDISNLLKLREISGEEAKVIFLYLCGGLALWIYVSALEPMFRMSNKFALGTLILANRRGVELAVSLVVLPMGYRPEAYCKILFLLQAAYAVFATILAIKVSHPGLYGLKNISWIEFRIVLVPALAYFLLPLAQTGLLQGTVQGVNQIAGTLLVVQFSISRTIMRLVLQIGQIVGNALRPELSRRIGQGESGESESPKIIGGTIILSSVCYAILVGLAPLISGVLSNGKVYISHWQAALVGAHALINIFWFVWASDIFSENRHGRITTYLVASSLITIVGWWVIKSKMDPILGASFALAIPEIVALIAVYKEKRRMKKRRLEKMIKI